MSDRNEIDCPRARSWMTPCVARDGATAIDDPGALRPVCVGCGSDPRALLADLAERYEPARRYLQTKDPRVCADTLTRMVAGYVNGDPLPERADRRTTRRGRPERAAPAPVAARDRQDVAGVPAPRSTPRRGGGAVTRDAPGSPADEKRRR